MKPIFTLILLYAFIIHADGQTNSIVRVFDYLTPYDNWQIEIFSNNTFNLTSSDRLLEDKMLFSGYCESSDSTIKFICDTSKVSNRNYLRNGLKEFSNIPFIAQGEIFKKAGSYFIPNNIIYQSGDSIEIPKGIFATYLRGDGFGNYLLQLKKDGTYEFTDHSCEMDFYEQGRWIIKKNIITLLPPKGRVSAAQSVTSNNQFYVDENFLIGKKTVKKDRATTTETYYYLTKQPLYKE